MQHYKFTEKIRNLGYVSPAHCKYCWHKERLYWDFTPAGWMLYDYNTLKPHLCSHLKPKVNVMSPMFNLDTASLSEIEAIEQKLNERKKELKDTRGFKAKTFWLSVFDSRFHYNAITNELSKMDSTTGVLVPSTYQFLLDSANKPHRTKPFIVKNKIDFMIELLTKLRNNMID